MTVLQHVGAWVAVLALAALLLWLVSPILLPFVVGAAVAYFLDPIVSRLQAMGVNRTLGSLAMILTLFGALAAGLAVLVPLVATEVASLLRDVPELFDRARDALDELLPGDLDDEESPVRQAFSDAAQALRDNVTGLFAGLMQGVSGLVGFVLFWVVMPVVAFYLLADWPRLIRSIDSALPRDHAPTIRDLGRQIDEAIAGFVRGEVIVVSILATYYSVGLLSVGLSYGLVIGIVAGLISFIPYVGAFVGGGLAIGFAIHQFWGEPWWIGAVVAIFLFGEFLESQVLVPRLVGSSVNLHPVWLIFAVMAFGSLFGLTGALIAVPLAAALGVMVRFGLSRYRQSPMYRGRRIVGLSE